MKALPAPQFLIYAVLRAVSHPRTSITYYYCSRCNLRFSINEKACPKCGDKVGSSPDPKQESQIPWYGSVILITVGAAIWGWSAACSVGGIDELGRALVYIPMGNLFGMSMRS
ncbi:hypothetical protein ES707_17630 [subsurface metagenome]